ncbi:MAG: hypothetical protein HOO06_04550 [Bdellovibrionaceae bacterium]|jgi:hypothetical protein|nr:hypothetical protein [Pseudobdellovibrionaceae bacterium]
MSLSGDHLHVNPGSPIVPPKCSTVAEQVCQDIELALKNFNDRKKGIKYLAKQIVIHEKTIKRLLEKSNKPGYLTLFKIYRFILSVPSDNQVLQLAPELIKKELLRCNPNGYKEHVEYNLDLEKEIKKNPLYGEIYFLAASGGVSKSSLMQRFGSYGFEIAEKMRSSQFLKFNNMGLYELGAIQLNYDSNTTKKIGLHLTERYARPEACELKGENIIATYAEGLSPEAYNQWLKIDEEAYYKKVELAKKPNALGNIKAFTFVVTDTMGSNQNKKDH